MQIPFDILLCFKYVVAGAIVVAVALAPSYLARQTKKDKYDIVKIRIASWLFGWTGVGWLWALWWATRK